VIRHCPSVTRQLLSEVGAQLLSERLGFAAGAPGRCPDGLAEPERHARAAGGYLRALSPAFPKGRRAQLSAGVAYDSGR
jgi:hypothetical protein